MGGERHVRTLRLRVHGCCIYTRRRVVATLNDVPFPSAAFAIVRRDSPAWCKCQNFCNRWFSDRDSRVNRLYVQPEIHHWLYIGQIFLWAGKTHTTRSSTEVPNSSTVIYIFRSGHILHCTKHDNANSYSSISWLPHSQFKAILARSISKASNCTSALRWICKESLMNVVCFIFN